MQSQAEKYFWWSKKAQRMRRRTPSPIEVDMRIAAH
jgi:hypothetical protein